MNTTGTTHTTAHATVSDASRGMDVVHAPLARRGLVRRENGKVVAGVCAGLAAKLGVDAWAVRAVLLVSMLLLPGSQILLYPVAWLLMPTEDQARRLTTAITPMPSPTPAAPQATADLQDVARG